MRFDLSQSGLKNVITAGIFSLVAIGVLLNWAVPVSAQNAAPAKPDTPTLRALHQGMVEVDWNDVSGANRYEVQFYTSSGWIDLPNAELGIQIFFYGSRAVATGLPEDLNYDAFHVRTGNSVGWSEWSEYTWQMTTHNMDWEGIPVPTIEPTPQPVNTPATGAPTISGTAQVGETLTASTSGIADADGLTNVSYSYQWVRNDGSSDTDITDATDSRYTLVDTDEGKTIKVRVSFTDDEENDESLTSAATATVAARPNTPATGAPATSSAVQVGDTLTADTSSIDDADGLTKVSYQYQWIRNDGNSETEIAGATDSTYTLADDDESNTVKVRVSFTDDAGNDESLTSPATATVAPRPNRPATGAPTISGTVQVSKTLTADTSSIADADGLTKVSYSYQWMRNNGSSDADITGATDATYTLVAADEGKTITVSVLFADDAGDNESMTSAATGTVAARPNNPATGAPTISGNTQVGQTLTADTSGIDDADGLTNVSYSYQWVANDGTADTDITSATDSSYTLAAADEGRTVKVKVSFTDDAGNDESLTSSATAAVEAAPNQPATGAPTISGTVQVSKTLTADISSIADADGLTKVSYSYQWMRNNGSSDADITGATDATYTLVAADEGKTITVSVLFADDAGDNESMTSAATGTVAARPNNPATGAPTISGNTQVGQTLTADTSGIDDADGLTNVSYSYQWVANDGTADTDITSATDSSYTLEVTDESKTIKVRVSFTDDEAFTESLTSNATEVVSFAVQLQTANNPATGAPTISGTAQAGETLTVDTSNISDGDGMVNVNFSYQWISNDGSTDTDITDETSSTYTIKPWDLGKHIKARVSFTDGAGNKETLTSSATTAVAASPNKVPTGRPFISGMAEVGQSLNVSVYALELGIRDGNGMTHATFSYQWIRNDGTTEADIPGATGTSYTLTDADEGKTVNVRVSFTDDGANEETLTSSVTTAVTARPSPSGLSAPTALSANWSRGEEKGIALEWMAPEGTVTGYQILRIETPTISAWWEPLPHGCTPLTEVHINDTGSDATTYTDTDVAESASYAYSVRPLNSDGVGRRSSSRGLQYRPPHTPTGSYWPSGVPGSPWRAPSNLYTTLVNGGIGLTWDAPSYPEWWDAPDREETGYQILRRRPEQCEFGYRVYVENTNSTVTRWADRDVVAGTLYEYHVRAINDVGVGYLERRNSTSFRPATLMAGPSPNSPATGVPTITGTAQVGETLTADPSGIADVDGLYWASFNYQWLSSRDTEIEGATSSTYTLQASDANKVIKVRVTFTDDAGYEESPTSAATGAVTSNVPATGEPAITGTAEIGETLTADTSGIVDSDGLDNVSFSYQWIRSDPKVYFDNNAIAYYLNRYDYLDIDGATSATYALTATDVGHTIKVRVTYTDDKGSGESLTSSATVTVPIEVAFTFSIEGTTLTCDSRNVDAVNIPYDECDDPSSTEQGTSREIEMEIEIARSVSSQLYKWDFSIYQTEDSLGSTSGEINDFCLGPGLADSALMEVTPDDGTGPFTYADEGTIFELCPAGTFKLHVRWFRYNYEDQEYEYAGTFTRYFFITGNDEVDTPIEQVKARIGALYPDPPVSHDDVQIEGTQKPEVLNRELATFSLTIDGLVPDSDPETTDYVVRLFVVGDDGTPVHWCRVGDVGSYLLKTVPEDGRWAMEAHLKGSCISHRGPNLLRIELLDGPDLTNYSEPIVSYDSHYGTHKFIAFKDIALDALSNSPATGAPTISGTAQVGETLTADTSGIADEDGLDNATFSYQWLSNRDTAISGATGSTYILVSTDLGNIIKVKVTFTDDESNEESLTSSPTASVADSSNNPATGSAAISGTAQVGQTLTAETSGIADADGLSGATFTYQWITNDGTADTDIQDATGSTYTLVSTDENKALKVRVSFTDDEGNDESLTSAATSTVAAAPNSPATGAPTVTGTAEVGDTLTAETSGIADADGLSGATFTYQWISNDGTDDTDISGATGSSYVLVAADDGKTIKVQVSFTDDEGNKETLTSTATKTVSFAVQQQTANSPATGAPTITGTAQVGETLTAETTGIADDDGLSGATFTYQWISNDGTDDTDITGATDSSYVLVSADESKALKVRVSFTDDVGNDETLTSASTSAVAAEEPPAQEPPAQPTGLTATVSHDSVSLTWDDPGDESITGYQILRRDRALHAIGEFLVHVDDTGNANTTFTDNDVEPSVQYVYRIKAKNNAGLSELSEWVRANMPAPTRDPNSPATGVPTVTGTAQVGEVLTADTSGIADADGLENATFSYQWVGNDGSSDTDITGATDTRYTLVADDVGQTIKVRVSFSDDAGNETTLTSTATGSVAARPNSPATGAPTITGTLQAGETLTVHASGIADDDGLNDVSYSYQWVANDGTADTDITGATDSSYTLVADDEGKTIKVKANFTDDAGNDESLTSAATAEVAAAAPTEPPGRPRNLTGAANADGTVTLSWDAPNDDTVTGYQILRRKPREGEKTLLVHVNDTGSTATQHTDRDVTPDVGHAYRVKAINAVGLSRWSNFVNVTSVQPAEPAQNSPAMGRPTISGTVQVGETLTANTSGIADDDGLINVSYSHQWIRNDGTSDTDITDATRSSYTLVDADEGQILKVRVSFTDDVGNDETLTSAATGEVEALPNRPATGAPSISGTAQVGETLTADTSGIADADGLTNVSYSYQWVAGGTDLGGATGSTYTVTASEQGETIQVRVSFTDDAGNQESLTSAATEAVAAKPNTSATGRPTIGGTAQVGETLTADTTGIADADGLTNVSYSYQWVANDGTSDADLGGATGSTYTLTASEQGQTIQVRVSFTDDAGNETTLTSAATEAVAAKANSLATGEPSISGTARVGDTLTVDTSGIADADGLENATFSYRWIGNDGSSDTDIAGATDSGYMLVAGDEGQTIQVRVSFTDDAGNEEALTSAATEAVAARPNTSATGRPSISGPARVGETLTVDTSGIADADGLENATFSYQWIGNDGSSDTDITGATDTSYTLVADDVGQTIKVWVSFSDDAGNETTLTSTATEAVAARPNTSATGRPSISGTVRVGEVLTADTSGIADDDGLTNVSYGYQWVAGGTDLGGATGSTYTLTASEQGKTIQVRVSFTDDAGNQESLTGAATDEVAVRPNTSATGRPTISGPARVGETLTVDTSGIADADGLTNVSYSYQWVATDRGAYFDISGETGASYTLVAADRGLYIQVRVSFTDDAGNRETLTSALTDVVAAAP